MFSLSSYISTSGGWTTIAQVFFKKMKWKKDLNAWPFVSLSWIPSSPNMIWDSTCTDVCQGVPTEKKWFSTVTTFSFVDRDGCLISALLLCSRCKCVHCAFFLNCRAFLVTHEFHFLRCRGLVGTNLLINYTTISLIFFDNLSTSCEGQKLFKDNSRRFAALTSPAQSKRSAAIAICF